MLNIVGTAAAPAHSLHYDIISDYFYNHRTVSGAAWQWTHRSGPCGTSSYPTSGLFKLSLPTVTKIRSVTSSLGKNQQLKHSLDEDNSVAAVNAAMHVRVRCFFILIKKKKSILISALEEKNKEKANER